MVRVGQNRVQQTWMWESLWSRCQTFIACIGNLTLSVTLGPHGKKDPLMGDKAELREAMPATGQGLKVHRDPGTPVGIWGSGTT